MERESRSSGDSLTPEQYLSLGHVVLQFGRGRIPVQDEWFLTKLGVTRRIEVLAMNFNSVPQHIVGTKRIATIHRRLAEYYARYLPVADPGATVRAAVAHRSRAVAWLVHGRRGQPLASHAPAQAGGFRCSGRAPDHCARRIRYSVYLGIFFYWNSLEVLSMLPSLQGASRKLRGEEYKPDVRALATDRGIALAASAGTLAAEVKTHSLLTSPNGRVGVAFSIDAGGLPRHEVSLDGKPVLLASRLGLGA